MLTVMPPISPEALCLTKTKCLQAMPLNQGTSSPFPMWFSLLGVIIEPHEPDSEHWEFINLTTLFLISLPITIIFLCSLTGIQPIKNSDMNGNALSLWNTDQNLAQYMERKKKHNKNNTCSNYQKNRLGNPLRVNLHCIRIHHNIAYAKAKCNTSQFPSRVKDLASVITCSSRHY